MIAHLNHTLQSIYYYYKASTSISCTAPIFPSGSNFLRQNGVLFIGPLKLERDAAILDKGGSFLCTTMEQSPPYLQNEKASAKE